MGTAVAFVLFAFVGRLALCDNQSPAADEPSALLQLHGGRKDRVHKDAGSHITVSGRQLLVDGEPLHLKGVNWNPIAVGGSHPANLDFAGFVDRDGDLMQQAGINAIRTYEAITDTAVLDALWERGIWVCNTVYSFGGNPPYSLVEKVNAVKDHPAILMWVIGNEWNYNNLYFSLSSEQVVAQIKEAARLTKFNDPDRPVMTVYGEVPSTELVTQLEEVDIWGLNAYRMADFGDLFDQWAATSAKPMLLGEYGADAWNSLEEREDEESQAYATTVLTNQIVEHSAVRGGDCLGGFIFELADEWWKDEDVNSHNTGGVAPGGGPYPDGTFNEEWWGLLDIDRSPRKAFHAYAETELPVFDENSSDPAQETPTPAPPASCAVTDECAKAVAWAMSDGIFSNPEWYEGLTSESTAEQFQEHLALGGHAGCTLPCVTTVTTTPTTTTTTTATTTISSTTSSCEPLSDECAKAVAWAMSDGIFSKPEWYEGLTSESTAEQFQEHLALGGHAGCTLPCATTVKTAPTTTTTTTSTTSSCEPVSDECRRAVEWAMETGINSKPEWYSGLSPTSTFEEFQAHIASGSNPQGCTQPCQCADPCP